MNKTDEALKLALEALEPVSVYGRVGSRDVDTAKAQEAITAIKQALAAQQEPVAWLYKADAEFDGKEWRDNIRVTTSKQVADWQGKDIQPLYTTPSAPPVPLTDDRLNEIESMILQAGGSYTEVLRAVADEAAHGITEKGQP